MDISISEEPLHGSGDGDDDLLVHSQSRWFLFFHHPDDGRFCPDFDDEAQGRAVAEEFLATLGRGRRRRSDLTSLRKESAMFDVSTNLGVLGMVPRTVPGCFIEERTVATPMTSGADR